MDFIFTKRVDELRGSGSKNAFAKKCGIKPTTMLGYLNGTSQPNLENLIKISKANGVTISWLAGEDVPKEFPKKTATITPYHPDPSMQELALWINEQDGLVNYWEIAKAKMIIEFPAFREWLKKHRGMHNQLGDEKLTSSGG